MNASGRAPFPNRFVQQFDDRRRQHVHSKKTEVMTRTQARHNHPLLRLRWRRFLEDLRHFVASRPVCHEPAADGDDGTVVSEVLRPGYTWKGRVVRPAMVKVRG